MMIGLGSLGHNAVAVVCLDFQWLLSWFLHKTKRKVICYQLELGK